MSAGTGSEQEANAVAADLSGNVYVTGYIKGSNNNFSSILINSAGAEDIFIAKYDLNGNILWAKSAGGSGNDRGMSIAVDNAGNVYVCGQIDGAATFFGTTNIVLSGPGNRDIFVAKFNSSGDVLWAKRGGASNDGTAYGVCTNGTDVFITGEFAGTVVFGALPTLSSSGSSDVFITAYYASTGVENWAVKAGSGSADIGNGIAVDATGIYVTGSYDGTITFQNMSGTLTNSGNSDVFVAKYTLTGNGIWKRKAGGTGDDHETCISVSGPYVYVAGHFANTMSLFNTGPAVATITSAGSDDAFIIQYDATTGNYAWVRSENGTGIDKARGVSANPAGEVFLTGVFTGTLPFGTGPSVTSGAEDVFVTKYSASGTFLWGKKVVGSGDDEGHGIVAPDNTSAYIAGAYKSNPATFDAIPLTTANNFDIFVAKLGCTVTVANAGVDQSLCNTPVASLSGNTPITGTGQWTLVSGTGIIADSSSPATTLSGLSIGSNVFQWTITNSLCGASTSDFVTIRIDDLPTPAAAGADQTICSSTVTLAGNTPALGTGVWTRISGSGTATTPTSPTSGVTGLSVGSSVYQWTITNGSCPSSTDQVTLTVDPNPTTANAGPDQTICSSSSTFAGNTPAIGTGMWTLVSGTGVVTTPSSPTSAVTSLSVGANVFRWTISSGTCPSSSDLITITVDPNPTISNAGPDQNVCSSSATFAGNVPTIGSGVWTLVSGTGIITTPSSATSGVTGLSVGANVFKWTITNGTCPASFDNVTITRDANPTTANAGPDQALCTASTTLAGNAPAIGTGTWTLVSGTGNITTPTSNTSGVTGLVTGPAVFQWTISNGTCPSSSDQVTINHDANPTVANAGPDQTICSSSATFAGNVPSTGTGFWTLISGTGIITTPSSATSTVTGLSVGANVFRWTISNGTCPSTFDEVTITRDPNPTTANAGPDQTICSASTSLAGNAPAIGTGMWTLISGTGTIVTPTSPTSTVNGLSNGPNVFRWTTSNGTCPSTFDNVTITRDQNPTVANAGPDQTICSASATFAGNTAAVGSGTWTLISGTGTIVTPGSPTSVVNGLSIGTNVFQWTISNGTCPSSSDQVIIIRDPNPTTANAGPDQALCAASTSLAGNAPTIGNGTWTLISGTGTIITPSSPTSTVNGLSVGANIFRWTISNGTCPASFDEVTITRDPNPTISNAGPDQTICTGTASLSGNTPVTGSGVWTLISGTGTISNMNSPATTVSGLSVGANVFQWTISNGTCPASTDQVTITRDPNPTAANAGPDQSVCAASATLAGNAPTIGSGTWTLISGTGTINTPTSPGSTVSGLSVGANVFRWTTSNGTCPSSTDDVTITRDPNPTVSNAGPDQSVCAGTATLAGNAPAIGTGTWTLVSGTGAATTPSSPTSGVTGLSVGANVFQWTIANGTCPSSTDQVIITRDPNPTTANAGPDQTTCAASVTLAGNTPAIGSGTWSLISGTGTIATPTSPTSTVSGLSVGANVFRWTTSNGTCPSSSDDVTITRDPNPTVANAGPDQTICSATTSLAGNAPSIGTGVWTLISGTGTLVTPTSPTSAVNGLSIGTNIFQWTISNGTCPSSSDQVTIIRDANPTVANAGPDQTLCASSTSLAGNTPLIGNGTWTLISGNGNIVAPTSPSSAVNALQIGAAVFQWTISNGTCPSSSDQVTITVDPNPTIADAGPDQTICSSSATFAGNTPAVGAGVWTLISGTGTIVSPASPGSTVNGLSIGANVFQWTISNGTCPSSADQVVITRDANPTPANAGPDQTICSSSGTLAGNAPVVGTGTWTLITGPATINAPASNTSAVSGMVVGANVFEWTVTNGVCPSSSDQVTINVDANPTVANAGADQTICTSASAFSANAPTIGTGAWTLISGTGVIGTINSETSTVTGLSVGANIFQWSISNGTCPASTDQVTIFEDPVPTTANAGPDQTICSSSSSLAGNVPAVGTGVWTLISGTGTIINPNSATSAVTGLTVGANVFQWTISNGTCPSSSDQVTINVDPNPTVSNAGSDQTICAASSSLSGNTPAIGTGTWSLISGTGIISTPSSPASPVTGLSIGANVFEWTVTNGTCPASTDQVIINVDANPTTSNAGPDQSVCSAGTNFAGNTPVIGTGTWHLISGTGTIVTPNSPGSAVNGLSVGANVFEWEIANGTCASSTDQVTIYRDPAPTAANAGVDQTICSSVATLSGNTPAIGSGNWTLVSGTGNIITPASPATGLTGLAPGANVFQWTISNGTCPASSDLVTITVDENPTAANAGIDQTLCSSASAFTASIPLIGNGTWSVVSGPGIISNASQPTSAVTNLATGFNSFEWTVSNGVCPSSRDTVVIFIDQYPTAADAGPDQQLCSSAGVMDGNTPVVGTGTWLLVSSTGNFVSASLPNTGVTNLAFGNNVFEWVVANGTCPASRDTVVIRVDQAPNAADAGPDQLICSSGAALQAVNPSIGTGAWFVSSGTGVVTNTLLPNSSVTNLSDGENKFEWVVTNGVCPVTIDTVLIYVDTMPTVANAGAPQTICSSISSLNANTPLVGSGQWSVISSVGTLADPVQPSTTVNDLGFGVNSFEWVISNGVCPASRDTVTITVDENPSLANAGVDALLCDPLDTLFANTPLVGSGTWYSLSSPPLLGNPLAPSTTVSNLQPGWNTFEWVITNGTCPATRDTVALFYTLRPSAPDAGPDIYECAHDVTMQAELPSIGTGTWSNLSNMGSFADPNSPSSALNNIPDGAYLYTWTTSNSYCVSRPDTVMVNIYSPPSIADAGPDQVVHTSFATLNAVACDTGIGTWSFVSGSGQFEDIHDPGTRVTDLAEGINVLRWTTSNGVCTESIDEMQIENKALFIPTGYSPNDDGTNDHFEIEGLNEYTNVSLEIFNRWGNQVYVTGDYKNDWNGTGSNGEILPDDIYYYVLKLGDGTALTGYVALKRRTL